MAFCSMKESWKKIEKAKRKLEENLNSKSSSYLIFLRRICRGAGEILALDLLTDQNKVSWLNEIAILTIESQDMSAFQNATCRCGREFVIYLAISYSCLFGAFSIISYYYWKYFILLVECRDNCMAYEMSLILNDKVRYFMQKHNFTWIAFNSEISFYKHWIWINFWNEQEILIHSRLTAQEVCWTNVQIAIFS
jgi:hypothetical protein